MNKDSLLSREESTAIKAVLIFFIVLGHNMLFTYSTEKYCAMTYIYTFHISAFFLLPFLYGIKNLSAERFKNYIIRILWPFAIFVVCAHILYYCIILQNKFDIFIPIKALFFGNGDILKKCTGIQIFWFLPAMFSLSIIKDIYDNSNKYIKISLLIISSLSLLSPILCKYNSDLRILFNILYHYTPLSAFKAISYLAQGVILRYIVSNTNGKKILGMAFCTFIIITLVFYKSVVINNNREILPTIRIVMPIIFTTIIFNIKYILSPHIHLQHIGSITLPMYLIHPFIGYTLFFIASRYLSINLLWAVVAQFIMFYGAYFLAKELYKHDKIRRKLLPNNVEEFLGRE